MLNKLKNSPLFIFLALLKSLFSIDYWSNLLRIRRKPRVLQMPITSRCQSKCLTCNIWKFRDMVDIDPDSLKRILSYKFFDKVNHVGINGGEPTLHPRFLEVLKAVLTLPKLKNIYVISNCIGGQKVLDLLEQAHILCREKNVSLNLQVSVDGIESIHNHIRGVNVSFERSMALIKSLSANRSKYVDHFDIGCTISKYNVDYLPEIETYLNQLNVPVYYHLAVPNKRIHNFDDAPFSVLTDFHSTRMASEFFYKKGIESKGINKIRYTLIYLYLLGKTSKRMFVCDYMYRDITINENLDSFLCATASDKVGNWNNAPLSNANFNKLVKPTETNCDSCIHYANVPNIRGFVTYFKYKFSLYKWLNKYK